MTFSKGAVPMTFWKVNGFIISTKKELLDYDMIFNFLSKESYWAKERTKETVEKSIKNSALCFGIFKEDSNVVNHQVGFARVISDLATYGYLCDVFVLPSYRGLGLSKWLIEVITNHPELKDIRRLLLATKDAHSLYAKYGFEPLDAPEMFMQITRK